MTDKLEVPRQPRTEPPCHGYIDYYGYREEPLGYYCPVCNKLIVYDDAEVPLSYIYDFEIFKESRRKPRLSNELKPYTPQELSPLPIPGERGRAIYLRVGEELADQLHIMAREQNISPQDYANMILRKHIEANGYMF